MKCEYKWCKHNEGNKCNQMSCTAKQKYLDFWMYLLDKEQNEKQDKKSSS